MTFADTLSEAKALIAEEQASLDDETVDHLIRASIWLAKGVSHQFLVSAWNDLRDEPARRRAIVDQERTHHLRIALAIAILAKAWREPVSVA